MSSLGTRLAALSKRTVPPGGTAGQVLTKTAAADYADAWTDPGSGWTYLRVAADWNTTSTTPVDVTGLGFTPVPGGEYEIEGKMLLRSAATTTGPRLGLVVPASLDHGFRISEPATTASSTDLHASSATTAPQNTAAAWPSTGVSYMAEIDGIFRATTATAQNPIKVTLASEILLSQVTIRTGSFLRYRKIN